MVHECPWLTLPQTNIFAPENGWLEYDRFRLGPGLFSGANLLLVSTVSGIQNVHGDRPVGRDGSQSKLGG